MSHGQPPNESRLSCGADLKCSQTECYHTACRMFSEPAEDGRRQLQALVRLLAHLCLSLKTCGSRNSGSETLSRRARFALSAKLLK